MTLTTRTIWIDAGHCDPNDPVLLQWLLGGRVGAVSLCSDPRKLPYPVSGKAGEVNPVTVASSLVEAWKDRCSVLAQDAADLLRPLYLESGSADGYVLVKNAPVHFLQGRRTFDEASALWGVIDRPNVMLGVPGSTSNLPAIRDLVAAGINVNVNKLYSRRQLRDVFAAVYDGLEARIATGQPISRIAVGASFDIFGLDHYIDKLVAVAIKAGADDSQMGKLAGRGSIAVARLVHHEAQKLVLGERFRNLSAKGAQEIRLVWDLAGEFGGGASIAAKDLAGSEAYRLSIAGYFKDLDRLDTCCRIPLEYMPGYSSIRRGSSQIAMHALGGKEFVDAIYQTTLLREVGIEINEIGAGLLAADSSRQLAQCREILVARRWSRGAQGSSPVLGA